METVLDYLKKYGNESFTNMPFNEVDSLILCQLSYLKFDGLVPFLGEKKAAVRVGNLPALPNYENLFLDVRFEENNRALMEGILGGKRFSDITLNYYINMVDIQWQAQFSAVTCMLDNGLTYVAFRGTDETIVGWKEDFNMGYLKKIPSQEYSVRYLEAVGKRGNGHVLVGGHSKGGNLAVYSAMNCTEEVRERIEAIYSFDGPGFRPDVLADSQYEGIRDRVAKYLPHSSLIGMLFETGTDYEVVESKTVGLMQHDPYSWVVEQNHLKLMPHLKPAQRQVDMTLNQWILSLDEEKLQLFVDTLYKVLTASRTDNLIDLTADWKKSRTGIVSAIKEIDEETRESLKQVISSLFELAGKQLKDDMLMETKSLLDETKERMKQGKAAIVRSKYVSEPIPVKKSENQAPDVPDATADQ